MSYIPKTIGVHKIFVTFLGKDIPKSPFTINVAEIAGDASEVFVSGPGLQLEGNHTGRSTYFDITSKPFQLLFEKLNIPLVWGCKCVGCKFVLVIAKHEGYSRMGACYLQVNHRFKLNLKNMCGTKLREYHIYNVYTWVD